MAGVTSNEGTGAKKSRFQDDSTVQAEVDEDYEIELHETGGFDDFGLNTASECGEDDDEEHVKVEIRNTKELTDRKGDFRQAGHANLKKRSWDNKSGGGEMSNRSKRPFEPHLANFERETDPVIISRRMKQIEYGKNTPEYFNYSQAVPK